MYRQYCATAAENQCADWKLLFIDTLQQSPGRCHIFLSYLSIYLFFLPFQVFPFIMMSQYTRVVCKVSNLAYNRQETRDKSLFGRDPDWRHCHLHTGLKLFLVAAHGSMDIGRSIRVWIHGLRSRSFTGVWRWHQLLSGSLPNGCLPRVSHRL